MDQIKAVAGRLAGRPLVLVAVVAVALAVLTLLKQRHSVQQPADDPLVILEDRALQEVVPAAPEDLAEELPAPSPELIVVYVSGAVANPGVYRLDEGARVDDVIRAAGGPVADAALTRVNLAARIHDEQHIHIPHVGEDTPAAQPPPGGGGTAGVGRKLNINTATTEELDALPQIGPTTAQRIVEYRTANGPFDQPEDLLQVKGIGPAVFEVISDLITVGP
ncbi:MAG: hypothetical protein KatS3mg057_1799 [Herpetosiphonaceae bacterium]|nr:MAG: hypothetical protein KatS3mg057_1799 [Herpetosiphonaceae bacterium]